MITTRSIKHVALAIVCVVAWCGCNKSSDGGPTPLPVDEMQSALSKIMQGADPEARTHANRYVSAMKAHDLPGAYTEMEMLMASRTLTEDQKFVLVRAKRTTLQDLQAAAANGDDQAAALLQVSRASK